MIPSRMISKVAPAEFVKLAGLLAGMTRLDATRSHSGDAVFVKGKSRRSPGIGSTTTGPSSGGLMEEAGLDDEQKELVRKRDWLGIVQHCVISSYLRSGHVS